MSTVAEKRILWGRCSRAVNAVVDLINRVSRLRSVVGAVVELISDGRQLVGRMTARSVFLVKYCRSRLLAQPGKWRAVGREVDGDYLHPDNPRPRERVSQVRRQRTPTGRRSSRRR